MNPFITNPHLLKPGDLVTLLEGVPVRKREAEEEEKGIPVKKAERPEPVPVPVVTGIDVSGLTNVQALGYLSVKDVKPWGFVLENPLNLETSSIYASLLL
jgi:hypothetical protein